MLLFLDPGHLNPTLPFKVYSGCESATVMIVIAIDGIGWSVVRVGRS